MLKKPHRQFLRAIANERCPTREGAVDHQRKSSIDCKPLDLVLIKAKEMGIMSSNKNPPRFLRRRRRLNSLEAEQNYINSMLEQEEKDSSDIKKLLYFRACLP